MKKNLFKGIFIFLTISSLSLLSSCSLLYYFFKDTEESSDELSSISIPEYIYLNIGETYTYSVSNYPYNSTLNDVVFSSSNEDVATVDSSTGEITPLKEGKTTIKVEVKDDSSIYDTSTLTVQKSQSVSKTKMNHTIEDLNDNSWYGGTDYCPVEGTPNLLIIPVWFKDSSNFITDKDQVRNDIKKAYLGSEYETGWNSVKSYYEKLSNNKLRLNATVSDWWECGYTSSKAGSLDDADELVSKAESWYFSKAGSSSRLSFDSDNNGHLDGIILIYGAPDYYSYKKSAGYDNLWAYTYWLDSSPSSVLPTANVYFWASYDFMYSSGSDAYLKTGKSTYGTGNTQHCKIDAHTYIHEMGHVLGLQDYYDYNGIASPAGGFSMQDENIGGHDPYSTLTFGYNGAYIPTSSCEITINPFSQSGDMILLTPSWNSDDSPFDEYLLLELYTPTGLNEFDSKYSYLNNGEYGPNKTGIRLRHVDSRLASYQGVDLSGNYKFKTNVTNPNVGNVGFMVNNTQYSSSDPTSSYYTLLGSNYYKYNQLQLIRNDKNAEYQDATFFESSDLFLNGDSFSISSYSSQFANKTKLNNGKSFTWTFSVKINGDGEDSTATITLVKS